VINLRKKENNANNKPVDSAWEKRGRGVSCRRSFWGWKTYL